MRIQGFSICVFATLYSHSLDEKAEHITNDLREHLLLCISPSVTIGLSYFLPFVNIGSDVFIRQNPRILFRNTEFMAVTITQNRFDSNFEAVELVVRDEREGRAGEAAAVDAHSALACQQLLAERDCERHILLFDIARRGHVLQQRPRRHAGFVDVVQERIKIV